VGRRDSLSVHQGSSARGTSAHDWPARDVAGRAHIAGRQPIPVGGKPCRQPMATMWPCGSTPFRPAHPARALACGTDQLRPAECADRLHRRRTRRFAWLGTPGDPCTRPARCRAGSRAQPAGAAAPHPLLAGGKASTISLSGIARRAGSGGRHHVLRTARRRHPCRGGSAAVGDAGAVVDRAAACAADPASSRVVPSGARHRRRSPSTQRDRLRTAVSSSRSTHAGEAEGPARQLRAQTLPRCSLAARRRPVGGRRGGWCAAPESPALVGRPGPAERVEFGRRSRFAFSERNDPGRGEAGRGSTPACLATVIRMAGHSDRYL